MNSEIRSSRETHFFCIGHKPPLFDVPRDFTMVTPHKGLHRSELLVPEDYLGDNFHGSMLSEYLQLFGLADYLSSSNVSGPSVFIFQYRKFLSLRQGTTRATNLPYCFASPGEEATSLFITDDELDQLSQTLLVGPCGRVERNLADHYGRHHFVEDFSCFVMALREIDGFDRARVKNFINCSVLFPAPSLGKFSTSMFLSHMGTLRTAWEVFASHYLQTRRGYQRRVGGFLLERLHSFLLYEYLAPSKDACVKHGSQIVVSDTANVNYTV